MTTKTFDCCSSYYSETADQDYRLLEMDYNHVGLRSHSFMRNRGKWGFYLEGLRQVDGAGQRELDWYDAEGAHITQSWYVFRLGTKPSSIHSATLRYANGYQILGTTLVGGQRTLTTSKMKCYGVKEARYQSRTVFARNAYNSTFKAMHWPQYGYPRRYRIDSFEDMKVHTEACVRWELTGSSGVPVWTPDISSVLQEIATLPNWDNTFCLCVAYDNNGGGSCNPADEQWKSRLAGGTNQTGSPSTSGVVPTRCQLYPGEVLPRLTINYD
jgi:hypothetical protein